MSELAGGVLRVLWGEEGKQINNIAGMRVSRGKNPVNITVLQDNKVKQVGVLEDIGISLRLVFTLEHLDYLQTLLEQDFVMHKLYLGDVEFLEGFFGINDISFQIDKEGLIQVEVSLFYGGEIA